MAPETKPARWKVVLGYAAFSLVAFLLCFFITFPYDTLRRRLVETAADHGYAVRIGSMRPGLRGLTATQVRASKVPGGEVSPELRALLLASKGPVPGPEELGEPLLLPTVALRPSLFPLGVAFHAELLGGSVSGSAGGLGSLQVKVKLAGLDPAGGNFKAFTGMDMEGKLSGSLQLNLPRGKGEPDLSQSDGQLELNTQGLLIKGGTVTIPMYGQPTPMDLPRIALGALTARLRFEKGQGTIDAMQIKSEDLEIQGTGTLKLGRRLDLSEPNMEIKIKAEPEFIKRLGLIGAGLSVLPADKQNPGFRVARLSGFLSRPNFGPAPQK